MFIQGLVFDMPEPCSHSSVDKQVDTGQAILGYTVPASMASSEAVANEPRLFVGQVMPQLCSGGFCYCAAEANNVFFKPAHRKGFECLHRHKSY